MNVHWTEAALADMRAIEAYISRHSPRYARATVERIFERTEPLFQHPHSGSVVPEYDRNDLRELIEQPYRIVYRVTERLIDIVAVIHGARRMPDNPLGSNAP